ncbi:MAG: hypothetical protein CM15mP18_4540 [Methanobacteriota archaeon]|nr:MAG: hypothetical protein CM15mP18_4540 [Euryarchaeota archaeon]
MHPNPEMFGHHQLPVASPPFPPPFVGPSRTPRGGEKGFSPRPAWCCPPPVGGCPDHQPVIGVPFGRPPSLRLPPSIVQLPRVPPATWGDRGDNAGFLATQIRLCRPRARGPSRQNKLWVSGPMDREVNGELES